jgi:hypothetical protein
MHNSFFRAMYLYLEKKITVSHIMWVVIIFHKFGSQLILNVRPVENVKSQCLLKIQTPAMSREQTK